MVHSNRRQDGLVSPKVGVAYHPPPPPPPPPAPPGEGYTSLYKEPRFQSFFSPMDRSLVAFSQQYDFSSTCARCAIQHSVSYCVK